MTIKCTAIMSYTSRTGRAGGWSESWYREGTVNDVYAPFDAVMKKRAGMMPANAVIVAYRFQEVGGKGRLFTTNIPGAVAGDNVQDVPQMSVYCAIQGAGIPNIKRFYLRGIPDGWVTGGDYNPGAGGDPLINLFVQTLVAGQFSFRYQKVNAAAADIAAIDADGNVTLLGNLAVAVNDKVTLLRVRNTQGKAVRGTYPVQTVAGAQSFKLRNYNGGTVATRGKCRKVDIDYALLNQATFTILHAATRKVGRPFASYHGRRTNR